MALADDRVSPEPLLLTVLDARDVDRLLERLRKCHGDAGRPDLARELLVAARRREAAAMVPAA